MVKATETIQRLPPSIPLTIDEEFKNLIPPLTDEEKAQLKANLIANGCRDPLVVWGNGRGPTLLDGHNRYELCREHGIDYQLFAQPIEDREAAKLWIIDNQSGRRNLNPFQRVRLALARKDIIAAQAKERQREGGKVKVPQNSAEAGETRDRIAKSANVSRDTVSRVERLLAKANPETREKLEHGIMSINEAYRSTKHATEEARREHRRQENRELVQQAPNLEEALGVARFATIVIDPPWDYRDEQDSDLFGRRPDYTQMPIDEIAALPIGDLADQDCHLYLWITNRLLPKGFALIDRWGFRYVTMLTWCKPSYGLGLYFRGQTEHVLFGVRGSQPLKRKDVGTAFHAPRGKDGHSSKPAAFYELVESCSPGPYLDVFARKQRQGWTPWGAECRKEALADAS